MDDGAWQLLAAVASAVVLSAPGWYGALRAHRVEAIAVETKKIVEGVERNTNGVSQRLETMAKAAGKTEGRDEERVAAAVTAAAVADAVTAASRTDRREGDK